MSVPRSPRLRRPFRRPFRRPSLDLSSHTVSRQDRRSRVLARGVLRSAAVLLSFALAGCTVISRPGAEPPASGPAPAAGPYEPVRRAEGLLFLSGQIGARTDGTIVPGGIAAETRRALERVQALVESEGSTMDRVVKCTVFLADVNEWDAMNEVYASFFRGRKPARSAVGGIEIPRNGRVEIECIATVG